jgi:hypothetical protein
MTEEKQNIAIYKLLGYKPVKSWKFYHDKEKTRASLGFRTKRDALERMEREKNSWPHTQFPQEYEFSEPEEYEDWSYCPQVDLDLLHKVEKTLLPERLRTYTELCESDNFAFGKELDLWNKYQLKVVEIIAENLGGWNDHFLNGMALSINATIKQRREALLKTLNLWEE